MYGECKPAKRDTVTACVPPCRAVGPMLGLLMSLSLVFPLAMLVRGLVEERERRLKETMCIMGLQARATHALRLTPPL